MQRTVKLSMATIIAVLLISQLVNTKTPPSSISPLDFSTPSVDLSTFMMNLSGVGGMSDSEVNKLSPNLQEMRPSKVEDYPHEHIQLRVKQVYYGESGKSQSMDTITDSDPSLDEALFTSDFTAVKNMMTDVTSNPTLCFLTKVMALMHIQGRGDKITQVYLSVLNGIEDYQTQNIVKINQLKKNKQPLEDQLFTLQFLARQKQFNETKLAAQEAGRSVQKFDFSPEPFKAKFDILAKQASETINLLIAVKEQIQRDSTRLQKNKDYIKTLEDQLIQARALSQGLESNLTCFGANQRDWEKNLTDTYQQGNQTLRLYQLSVKKRKQATDKFAIVKSQFITANNAYRRVKSRKVELQMAITEIDDQIANLDKFPYEDLKNKIQHRLDEHRDFILEIYMILEDFRFIVQAVGEVQSDKTDIAKPPFKKITYLMTKETYINYRKKVYIGWKSPVIDLTTSFLPSFKISRLQIASEIYTGVYGSSFKNDIVKNYDGLEVWTAIANGRPKTSSGKKLNLELKSDIACSWRSAELSTMTGTIVSIAGASMQVQASDLKHYQLNFGSCSIIELLNPPDSLNTPTIQNRIIWVGVFLGFNSFTVSSATIF